ncbi:unnamed protein product [Arctia plantaginis]|uniref:Major facilitator superfamily (MFS) profile domain-containing protein n=1 Tax=Arctia plantaginis TaxID=874455 RepID=A0A8S0Z2Y4_ARCPL|nr:unnamed protein product [Arctia plantaginis]
MEKSFDMPSEKLPFEAAMDKVGFGLYGVLLTALTAMILLGFSCIAYSTMFIVPTSACELATTPSQQGILAAGPIAGLLLGGMIWSYLADTRGRRTPLIMSLIFGAVFNTIGTISVNWIMLLIFQFLGSFCSSGLYLMSMSLLSESVPMANRSIVVIIVSSVTLVAQGFMARLGIYWNSWRMLLLIFSIPHIFSAICLVFMQESPKFVFTKGDENKALEILQAIHYINNWTVDQELQVKCLLKDEVSVIIDSTSKSMEKDHMSLFRMPLLKNIIIMLFLYTVQQFGAFFVWLPKIADQFVRIIQTGDKANLTMCRVLNMKPRIVNINETPCSLDETSLLIVLSIGVLQAIFNFCVGYIINFVGRRNMTMVMFLASGVSSILVNLVPHTIGSAALFIFMSMGGIVYGLCTSICVDLFLTNLRTLVIAMTMTTHYVGTVASIQIFNLSLLNHCDTSFYLFGSILVLAAVVTSFLPNDLQVRKQTIQLELVDIESLMDEPRKEN